MKTITEKTVLKQGDKTFKAAKVFDIIRWFDESDNIIAQNQPILDGVPVVNLDKYILKLAPNYSPNTWIDGYKSNPNQYTQKDIEKSIELARKKDEWCEWEIHDSKIIEQLNTISLIEVDEQFNILSYE